MYTANKSLSIFLNTLIFAFWKFIIFHILSTLLSKFLKEVIFGEKIYSYVLCIKLSKRKAQEGGNVLKNCRTNRNDSHDVRYVIINEKYHE